MESVADVDGKVVKIVIVVLVALMYGLRFLISHFEDKCILEQGEERNLWISI